MNGIKSFKDYKKSVLEDKRSKKIIFKKDKRNHYVYRVTDLNTNEYYYGSRTTDTMDCLTDFWNYGTSSKTKDILNNRNRFKVKIIKKFDNPGDKIIFESFLHQLFNVKSNKKFWNKSNQTPFGFDTTNYVTVRDKDQHKNILKSEFDKGTYTHTNKDYIITKEKGRVTRNEYEEQGLSHINKGLVDVIINGKVVKIPKDEYQQGGYISTRHNTIIVFDKNTKSNKTIQKSDYDESIHESVNKNMVKAISVSKMKIVTISKDVFDIDDDLVGVNSSKISIFNDKGELIIEEVGNIKSILKREQIPLSLSSKPNTPFKPNPQNKSIQMLNFLNKYEGWYWKTVRLRDLIKNA